jgi:hypothetical protein
MLELLCEDNPSIETMRPCVEYLTNYLITTFPTVKSGILSTRDKATLDEGLQPNGVISGLRELLGSTNDLVLSNRGEDGYSKSSKAQIMLGLIEDGIKTLLIDDSFSDSQEVIMAGLPSYCLSANAMGLGEYSSISSAKPLPHFDLSIFLELEEQDDSLLDKAIDFTVELSKNLNSYKVVLS